MNIFTFLVIPDVILAGDVVHFDGQIAEYAFETNSKCEAHALVFPQFCEEHPHQWNTGFNAYLASYKAKGPNSALGFAPLISTMAQRKTPKASSRGLIFAISHATHEEYHC